MGLFVVLFAALWLTWISEVTYADLAGSLTHVRTVVVTMFLVAVMAATAPTHFEERANAFAIAFVLCRMFLARRSLSTGKVLTTWPLLQFGGFTLPWIASVWVPTPWKFWLWALGVAVDLASTLRQNQKVAQRRLARYQQLLEQEKQRAERAARHGKETRRFGADVDFTAQEATLDAEHLDERLGVFVIIVLGEAVAQLVLTASTTAWTRPFVSVTIASFLILVMLWQLTFAFGFTAAPGASGSTLPPRFRLPLHLLGTLGILLLAVGLASMARDSSAPLEPLLRWVMCGGISLHFLAALIGGVAAGPPRHWLWGTAVPTVVAPVLLALAGGSLADSALAWLLLAIVAWHYLYATRTDAVIAKYGLNAFMGREAEPGRAAGS